MCKIKNLLDDTQIGTARYIQTLKILEQIIGGHEIKFSEANYTLHVKPLFEVSLV